MHSEAGPYTEVSFTPRTLFRLGKLHFYPLNRSRLGGRRSRSERCAEEKYQLPLPGTRRYSVAESVA